VVDDEVFVGGHGVETGDGSEDVAGGAGEIPVEDTAEHGDLFGGDGAVDGFRIAGGETVVATDFDPDVGGTGDTVVMAFVDEEGVDRTSPDVVEIGFDRGEVDIDDALDGEGEAEVGENATGPGTSGDDEAVGAIGALGGFDADAGAVGRPVQDGLSVVEIGAVAGGEVELGCNAFVGENETGVGFENGDEIVGEAESGVAGGDVGGGEFFVGKSVEFAAAFGAEDGTAVWFADDETAVDEEEAAFSFGFQFAPEDGSAFDEGDVVGGLVVSLADDAVVAVGGTSGVAALVGIETKNALTALGEVEGSSAAHRTETENDDIGTGGHVWGFSAGSMSRFP
jgi:hypothetical protein